MNRCPKCQTIYNDQTLFFCLEDGEKLVLMQSFSSPSSPTVVVVPSQPPQNFSAHQTKTTKSNKTLYLGLIGAGFLIALLSIGGMAFIIFQTNSTPENIPSTKNQTKNSEGEKPSEINQNSKNTTHSNQCDVETSVYETVTSLEFQLSSTKLSAESVGNLEGAAERFKALSDSCLIEIEVHSDNVGNSESNKKLTQSRADEIKNQLTILGVNSGKIKAIGFGDTQPIYDNLTETGRAKNRRVELKILSNSNRVENNFEASSVLDFTKPETLSYLESRNLQILLKTKGTEPNPLLLNVTIAENGDLALNNRKLGNALGENILAEELVKIFEERENNKTLAQGANTIEKKVTIKPPIQISREIFDKTCEIIKETKPSTIQVAKP